MKMKFLFTAILSILSICINATKATSVNEEDIAFSDSIFPVHQYQNGIQKMQNAAETIQLDSTVSIKFGINDIKNEYIYKNNDLEQERLIYNWNSTQNKWIENYKLEYVFNSNQKLISDANYIWNGTTQTWTPQNKKDYYFDEQNKSTGYANFLWNTIKNAYVKTNMKICQNQYNDSGYHVIETMYEIDTIMITSIKELDYNLNNKITQVVRYAKNWLSEEFQLMDKTTDKYDSQNNIIESCGYYYDNENKIWILKNRKSDFIEDKTLNTFTTQLETRHPVTFNMYLYLKSVIWKNNDGFIVRKSTYNYKIDNSFKETSRTEYYKNINNFDTLKIEYDFNSSIDSLVEKYKSQYILDENNKMIFQYNYQKDSVGKDWIFYWKIERIKLENNIATYLYSNFDVNNQKWQIYRMEEDNLIFPNYAGYRSTYEWNNADSCWVGLDKYESLKDIDFRHLEYKSYLWDKTTQDWYDYNFIYYYYSTKDTSDLEQQNDLSLKIYPNPSIDKLFISIPSAEKYNVSVFSIDGCKHLEKTILSNQHLDISKLNNGLYLLNVECNGKNYSKKFIKRSKQ
jgi:hypothetical protein